MHHSAHIRLAEASQGGGIGAAWNNFIDLVWTCIGFLAILIVGSALAKLAGREADKALRRVGFDRLIRRAELERYLARGRQDASKLVGRFVHYLLELTVLWLAFGLFGSNAISRALGAVLAWIPRGLFAVAIVLGATVVARALREVAAHALADLPYHRTLGNLVAALALALGATGALGQAGIGTAGTDPLLATALALMAGVIVLGVGEGLLRPVQPHVGRALETAEHAVGHAFTVAYAGTSAAAQTAARVTGRVTVRATVGGVGQARQVSAQLRQLSGWLTRVRPPQQVTRLWRQWPGRVRAERPPLPGAGSTPSPVPVPAPEARAAEATRPAPDPSG